MIPQSIIEGLDRYAKHYIPTGGFLRAVLEHDLFEAVGRADLGNQMALAEIVIYIYNELPVGCHGSKEKVDAWLARRTMDLAITISGRGNDDIDP